MSERMTVLDPVAPTPGATAGLARALEDLQGRVVGFIDNAKPNFNHLVDDLAALLVQRHGVQRVVKHRKPGQVPVAASALARLTEECDLVITGSGD